MRELEAAFGDELTVVGVHAGKYWAERETANIRQACLRLGVDHPVINDRAFRTWRAYGVGAWPTLVLVDPRGEVLDVHPGEITAATYAPMVARVLEEARRQGTLQPRALPLRSEAALEPARPLAFPSKVLAAGEHLFIADTGHNRIVAARLSPDGGTAQVEWVAGRGEAGRTDGAFDTAAFNRPHGLALGGGILYVADTENHTLRALDLSSRRVSTVAGTGEPSRRYRPGAPPLEIPLSSPWDLTLADGALYTAMAGSHQLWRLDLAAMALEPFAGTGREDITDGTRRAADLAQPMGLCTADDRLVFADSESSAIREVGLMGDADVHTLVGTGLFDFGDRDGVGEEVQLQHAQGVCWHQGTVYIADSYNNKIKALDPATRRVRTLAGSGEAGLRDGDSASFWEPEGITAHADRLYIADTNNHAIRTLDVASGRVYTLGIAGL
ncbi:MAG: alkyl hydroperoxide reductase [Anaerolineae bacterium]